MKYKVFSGVPHCPHQWQYNQQNWKINRVGAETSEMFLVDYQFDIEVFMLEKLVLLRTILKILAKHCHFEDYAS